MAELQRSFVGRWPVAVLTAAGVAAVSLGDVFAGLNALAGRGSSETGEYPIRIMLPRPLLGTENTAVTLPPRVEVGSERGSSEASAATNDPAGTTGQAVPDDARVVEIVHSGLRPGTRGLLEVDFDLADAGAFGGGSGGSVIELRKAVRINGTDAGDARIRVSGDSMLSIAREELGRLLAGSGQQALIERMAAGGRFVSFDEMRRQGVQVRYDPVSDRILVST